MAKNVFICQQRTSQLERRMWPKKPQLIQEDKTLQMQSLYILEENHFDLDNIEWVQKKINKQTKKTRMASSIMRNSQVFSFQS